MRAVPCRAHLLAVVEGFMGLFLCAWLQGRLRLLHADAAMSPPQKGVERHDACALRRGRTGKLACSSMSGPKSMPAWSGAALALQQHGSSGPIPSCPPQQLPRSMLAA